MKQTIPSRNTIIQGDCIAAMASMPARSVDFILTDPPYLVRYKDRTGRSIANDDNADWLEPAAREMYRVLKNDSLCVSFYGWTQTDRFISAWRTAGFRIVGHIVFRKRYASKARFVSYTHESAYAGEGPARFAGEPTRRCHRLGLYRQPPAPDAEAGRDPDATD